MVRGLVVCCPEGQFQLHESEGVSDHEHAGVTEDRNSNGICHVGSVSGVMQVTR